MKKNKKHYITTPIYYVNDVPHIGHAYTSLACDAIARFERLSGSDVYFLTGTDEHGQKVEKSAQQHNMAPKVYVDSLIPKFKEVLDTFNISSNGFIRTTDSNHIQFVQKIWKQMEDNGDIYLGKYSGFYAIRDETFYAENELIDGKAPTGSEVEWTEDESYFFRLSNYQTKLLDFYQAHPDFVAPEGRYNEVISFVKRGLKDISISRTAFTWGISVPTNSKHIIYVWLDALFNYVSAISNDSQKYWPCDLHVIGKDILTFHAVYWPAFLMSVRLQLPQRIFAHGWWMNEGQKMSKSIGNVINPKELIQEFGCDYVRYFMLREMPFGNDGSYSRVNLISRINAELANNIGNLVQRSLAFICKNCNAQIPQPHNLIEEDNHVLNIAYEAINKMSEEMGKQAIHNAINIITSLSHQANVYIDKCAPWKLKLTDTDRMNTVLYVLAECIRIIGILLQPFIPESANRILHNFIIYSDNINIPFASIKTDKELLINSKIIEPRAIFVKLDL
ncbi:Methionine--tRNA ligase [Alphaproteobacteria bacterium]